MKNWLFLLAFLLPAAWLAAQNCSCDSIQSVQVVQIRPTCGFNADASIAAKLNLKPGCSTLPANLVYCWNNGLIGGQIFDTLTHLAAPFDYQVTVACSDLTGTHMFVSAVVPLLADTVPTLSLPQSAFFLCSDTAKVDVQFFAKPAPGGTAVLTELLNNLGQPIPMMTFMDTTGTMSLGKGKHLLRTTDTTNHCQTAATIEVDLLKNFLKSRAECSGNKDGSFEIRPDYGLFREGTFSAKWKPDTATNFLSSDILEFVPVISSAQGAQGYSSKRKCTAGLYVVVVELLTNQCQTPTQFMDTIKVKESHLPDFTAMATATCNKEGKICIGLTNTTGLKPWEFLVFAKDVQTGNKYFQDTITFTDSICFDSLHTTIDSTATLTWVVQVTDQARCSVDTAITFPANLPDCLLPDIPISSLVKPCPGFANGTCTLTPPTAKPPFLLMKNGTAVGVGTSQFVVKNLAPGIHQFEIVDAENHHSATTLNLVEQAAAGFSVQIQPPNCPGEAGFASIISSNSTNPVVEANWNFGLAGLVDVLLPVGQSTVNVEFAGGCASSATVILQGIQPLKTTFLNKNPTCTGGKTDGEITLEIGGGTAPFSAKWSTQQSGLHLTGLAAGLFSATISDAHGCTVLFETSLVEPLPPAIQLFEEKNPTCTGFQADGQLTFTATVPALVWSWKNPDGSLTVGPASRSNLRPGNYELTATDAAGCETTVAALLADPICCQPNFSLKMTLEQPWCPPVWGRIRAKATGGTAPFLFEWSDGLKNSSLLFAQNGQFSLTVTDAEGCSLTASESIPDGSSIAENLFLTATPLPAFGKIRLNWKAENEWLTGQFVLERTADGQAFEAVPGIDPIDGLGFQHTQANHYQVIDAEPMPSTSQYRLRHFRDDGQWFMSNLATASMVSDDLPDVQLLPNLTADEAHLRFEKPLEADQQLFVSDAFGREIPGPFLVEKGSFDFVVDFSGLPSGLYFLRIKPTANSRDRVFKLVLTGR